MWLGLGLEINKKQNFDEQAFGDVRSAWGELSIGRASLCRKWRDFLSIFRPPCILVFVDLNALDGWW